MNTRMITFKTGPSRSPNGDPLPNGSDIPKMRGRASINLNLEIERLTSALELLSDTPCSFWACKGAAIPRHMIICTKCYAMRDIASVRSTLLRKQLNL